MFPSVFDAQSGSASAGTSASDEQAVLIVPAVADVHADSADTVTADDSGPRSVAAPDAIAGQDNAISEPVDSEPVDSEPVEAEPTESGPVDFAALGLPRQLVRALHREGIDTPFEIQRATVPDALAGRDVLGRGQTGSGKTLAFGLPVLARMAAGPRARAHHPRALILVPTRELAMQVNDALMPLGRAVGVFLKTAVGGVPYDRQIDSLRRGVEIVVATPGRLADLIERGVCRLDDIEVTVLDEADQMADMGFLPDVTELLAKTPADAQRLLFSATLDNDVDSLVKRFMTDPVTHSTAPPTAAVSTMDHHMLLIPPHDKFAVAASIAARQGRTMMFARTQMGVDRLVEQLAAVGVRAGALHGGKTQRVRTRTLAEFKEGRTNVLVATDVAARGIHVDGVSLVVHVDPPKDPKDYLHRAGRTARAGESGAVATLVLPKQRRSTLAMLQKAGVEPEQTRVRPGDAALAEVTGAREPSGVPVVDEPAPRRGSGTRPDRPRSDRRYGDRPRADRRYGDRPQEERRHSDGPQGERRYGDRFQGERRYGDRPQSERRYGDRRFGDGGGTPQQGGRTERGGEWRSGGRQGGFRHEGRPHTDRPVWDRSRDERPREDRPAGDRPDDRRGRRDHRFDGRRPTPTR
ncbi:DEAD/DEAH box helicase [Plantactinospora sp. CA-294935]|uniref:DEAD/DEAH box helicase n=1 Tax=Plantactinospora sp. CA-294935 TaxID=3240012 RepID=UPI003D9082A9